MFSIIQCLYSIKNSELFAKLYQFKVWLDLSSEPCILFIFYQMAPTMILKRIKSIVFQYSMLEFKKNNNDCLKILIIELNMPDNYQ